MSILDELLQSLVAEEQAVCEVCGSPAHSVTLPGGYHGTLCSFHAQQYINTTQLWPEKKQSMRLDLQGKLASLAMRHEKGSLKEVIEAAKSWADFDKTVYAKTKALIAQMKADFEKELAEKGKVEVKYGGCQVCGKPGRELELYKSYHAVLCDQHRREFDEAADSNGFADKAMEFFLAAEKVTNDEPGCAEQLLVLQDQLIDIQMDLHKKAEAWIIEQASLNAQRQAGEVHGE